MPRDEAQAKLDSIAEQIGQQVTMGADNEPAPQETLQNDPTPPPAGEPAPGEGDAPQIDPDEQHARDMGWLPLDEYQQAGHDPSNWSGHKAFLRYRERQDQQRELKQELEETKRGVNGLLDRFERMTQQQQNRHKKELQAAMDKAKTDLDFGAYEEAAGELKEIEKLQEKPAAAPPQSTEHPVIQKFRADNPELLKGGDQYNDAFNRVMESRANERIMNLSAGGQVQLTDAALQQALQDAYRDTKAAFPTQQAKPNGRKAPATGTPRRAAPAADPVSFLDTDARDHYNFIKKKAGERAAKRFLELHKENDA